MKNTLLKLLATTAVASLLVGCGSSSDDTTPKEVTPTNEPVVFATTLADVAKTTTTGATIATVTATDADGADIVYSFDGNTTIYDMNATTGSAVVTLKADGATMLSNGTDLPNFVVCAKSTTGETSEGNTTVDPKNIVVDTPYEGPITSDNILPF